MFRRTTATKKIIKLFRPTTGEDGIKIPPKRLHGVPGGTSASKTISILMFLIAKAGSDFNRKTMETFPTLTSIVSESFPHLKRGSIRDFLNIMQSHGYFKQQSWNATDSVYTFETGSKIEFFSSDNGDKLRGARRDRLFINEANNVTFDAFEQLEVRTKDFVILDWNPSSEYWWYTEVMPNRNDWDMLTLTYRDNESLDQSIIDSIEQRKNRKGWWKVYGEGQLGEVEGKIYSNWKFIDEIPHEAKLERYGLDFGYSVDPTAIVAIYYYNGGYILDEVLFIKGMSNKQIADTLNSLDKALVIADSAEPKSIAEIKSYGVNILPTTKGRDSVRNGIQIVQEQTISVTKQSTNLINSYRNYLWMVDKQGKLVSPNIPEHTFSDIMDAVRYGLTHLVPFKKPSVLNQYTNFNAQKPRNPAL